MKIGIAQFEPVFGYKEKNIETAISLVKKVDADLIVLPELFTTGYIFLESDNLLDYAEPLRGNTTEIFADLSRKEQKAIVGGFAERDGETFYNSQFLITPNGEIHLYRKIHLFDREKIFFTPGNIRPEPFDYNGVKIGLLVCFDWIFPEIYRTYAIKGTDIICHSTNLVLPWSQRASFARAVENRMYIALSNRTGTESRGGHKLRFTGGSIAYSPKGEILLEGPTEGEFTDTFDLNTELSRNKNVTERNHLFNDRRPEMY